MRFIQPTCYCLWTLHIACTFHVIPKFRVHTNRRIKRNTEDKFNVLLNLYKFNPLRHSKVFEMFSNKILLPYKDSGGIYNDALHYNENESIKEKQTRADVNLKKIQDAIHSSRATSKRIGKPDFEVDIDTVPERFSSELTVKELIKEDLLKPKHDAFKDIFGHIVESKETAGDVTDVPVTNTFDRALDLIPTTVSQSVKVGPIHLDKDNYKVYRDDGVVVMR